MTPLSRLTVRNLLNTVAGFPEAVRNDPWARSYTLALGVIKHFLGEDWIEQHLKPESGAKGFLQPDMDAPEREVDFFRTVDLGELLFNLQNVEGFDGCASRLKGGDIQGALAELDIARMLFINDHPIWFHEPEGESGNNCDFILLAYGMAINAELPFRPQILGLQKSRFTQQ